MTEPFRPYPTIGSEESVGHTSPNEALSDSPLEARFAQVPPAPQPPPETPSHRVVTRSASTSGSHCSGELRAKVRGKRRPDSLAYEKLLHVTRVLTSCKKPKELFETVLDAALDVTGAWRGFLFLLGPDGLNPECSLAGLKVAASRGISPGELSCEKFRASRSAIVKAVKTGRTASWGGAKNQDWSSHSLDGLGSHSILCEPLRVEDRILGVVYLDSGLSSQFNDEHERLLPSFAAQAAICLENSRLQFEREEALKREFAEQTRAKELQVYQETLSSFMAIASHDLKSPLSVMRTGIALLKRDLPAETKAQVTEFLENAIQKANRLISSYLDIQQLENGQKLRLRYERLSLLNFLNQERDTAMNLVMEHNHGQFDIRLEVEPDVELVVDAERFSQIIGNLLSNAVKYSPNGGCITIRHSSDAMEHKIHITDEGIGMSQEGVQRLFGRFVRLKNDHSIRGTGLGLFTVRRLTEAHGGQVEVCSQEGEGTTFTVTLPRQVAALGEPV